MSYYAVRMIRAARVAQGPFSTGDQAASSLSVSAQDAALHVHSDQARLLQSVVNVLTNAIKYTNPGGEITSIL